MDIVTILIAFGFVFIGILIGLFIGYKVGYFFGKRDDSRFVQQRAFADILSAEVIE